MAGGFFTLTFNESDTPSGISFYPTKDGQWATASGERRICRNVIDCTRYDFFTTFSYVAMLIIGALALSGTLNSIVAGGTLVGLAGLGILMGIIRSISDKRVPIIDLVVNLAIVVISALAIVGVLPMTVAGWCAICPLVFLAGFMIFCLIGQKINDINFERALGISEKGS